MKNELCKTSNMRTSTACGMMAIYFIVNASSTGLFIALLSWLERWIDYYNYAETIGGACHQ